MAWRSAAAPRVIRLALGENDPVDAAGSAGVPGIRIDFRSGLKLQDYSVLRLSCVRILAGCVCDATLDANATLRVRGPALAIITTVYTVPVRYIPDRYTSYHNAVCDASARGVGARASRRASGATAPMRAGSATTRRMKDRSAARRLTNWKTG